MFYQRCILLFAHPTEANTYLFKQICYPGSKKKTWDAISGGVKPGRQETPLEAANRIARQHLPSLAPLIMETDLAGLVSIPLESPSEILLYFFLPQATTDLLPQFGCKLKWIPQKALRRYSIAPLTKKFLTQLRLRQGEEFPLFIKLISAQLKL